MEMRTITSIGSPTKISMNGMFRQNKYLLTLGWHKNKPGIIHKCFMMLYFAHINYDNHSPKLFFDNWDGIWSEISLVHPNDIDWFLTMQAFGSQEQVSNLLKAADTIQLACMASLLKEKHCIPSLFWVRPSSNEGNSQFNLLVCDGSPIVTAKYAQDEITTHLSQVESR